MDQDTIALIEKRIMIDRIPLNYMDIGSGDQVVMLCCGLCGFAENDYGPVIRKMDKSKFRIICPDPPGYGKSRPHHRDFGPQYIERDAKVFLKLLDVLNIQKLSVVGWSSGGSTGQVMAIMEPARVTRLVFWGAFSTVDDTLPRFVRIFRNPRSWSAQLQDVMIRTYGESYWSEMLTNYGNGTQHSCLHFMGQSMIPFEKIRCPTLVIHGQQDPILRQAQAEKYVTVLEGRSRLHLMPTGAHDLQLTHTDEFVKIVQDFISSPADDALA